MILRILVNPLQLQCTRLLYTGARSNEHQLKSFLAQFQGGSVDLVKKDNGIAHIVLNHPERRTPCQAP